LMWLACEAVCQKAQALADDGDSQSTPKVPSKSAASSIRAETSHSL